MYIECTLMIPTVPCTLSEKGGALYFLSEDLRVFQGGSFSHASFGKKMNMIAGTEVINGDKK